eukprot:scaffold42333_cov49-Tisochrysis_lutea.AAC.1
MRMRMRRASGGLEGFGLRSDPNPHRAQTIRERDKRPENFNTFPIAYGIGLWRDRPSLTLTQRLSRLT